MQIIGSNFTSDPKPGKTITAALCRTKENQLIVENVEQLGNFQSFALLLASKGPWIAGLDSPFGEPQQLIDDLAWPNDWKKYVEHVARLGKRDFQATLNAYRAKQPKGKKEHFRVVDRKAKSISPMKLYGVPVGVMFCEGATFLLASPASVVPLVPDRDVDRMIVETYPKLVATKVVGNASYKTGDNKRVTAEHGDVRKRIIDAVRAADESIIRKRYGFYIVCDDALADSAVKDPSGDILDALLCSLQAAWSRRSHDYGIPDKVNKLEGWITDPELLDE